MSQLLYKLNISTRMSVMKMSWYNLAKELRGFRKWCLLTFVSRRFTLIQYWVLILNLVPIAGEITMVCLKSKEQYSHHKLEREFIAFEIVNGILALVYIFDAIVGIVGLGCRNYCADHGNKLDFFITFAAFCEMILGLVVFTAFRDNYSMTVIYILLSLSLLRLIRLTRILLSGIFQTIMDEACSVIYNVYDLAIGVVVANEEITKKAKSLINYEPSADYAQFVAENNILQMLSCVEDLEKDFSDVSNAWMTHRATIYVLRNMKNTIREMQESYVLDESDCELLLEILDLKIKDTLCAPRYLSLEKGMRHTLKNVLWILNDKMLDTILDNYSITSYTKGETVQEAGKKHEDLKLISSGIVQVIGRNDGEKNESIPNTDSLYYFLKEGSFCSYEITPHSIGLLGYLLNTESVTTATCMKDSQMINISYETLQKLEENFGDISFAMWKPIALEIARNILMNEEIYENWTEEKIKIHLDEAIFPNLDDSLDFEVHPVISDMVLIQGRVKDAERDVIYTGPIYIPSDVRHLTLVDDQLTRSRVVLVLLRAEKYHFRTIDGWIDPKDINYKSLCLVHGMRRASLTNPNELNEVLEGPIPDDFALTMGHIFHPKGYNFS